MKTLVVKSDKDPKKTFIGGLVIGIVVGVILGAWAFSYYIINMF